MNTQLSIHAHEIPTFQFTDHGTFQVLRLVTKTDTGDATWVSLFLPHNTTLGDIMKAVADAEVRKPEVRQKAHSVKAE